MTQAAYRAAAVQLLAECGAALPVQLQVYRARPASIKPPTAFVDSMQDETPDFLSPAIFQHVTTVNLVCIWGLFDSGEAADQRDAFVDAFHEYVRTRYHEAGATTLIRPAGVVDDPAFVPDWLPRDKQATYYATKITLVGDATD